MNDDAFALSSFAVDSYVDTLLGLTDMRQAIKTSLDSELIHKIYFKKPEKLCDIYLIASNVHTPASVLTDVYRRKSSGGRMIIQFTDCSIKLIGHPNTPMWIRLQMLRRYPLSHACVLVENMDKLDTKFVKILRRHIKINDPGHTMLNTVEHELHKRRVAEKQSRIKNKTLQRSSC